MVTSASLVFTGSDRIDAGECGPMMHVTRLIFAPGVFEKKARSRHSGESDFLAGF
jgi:hypothetical protein